MGYCPLLETIINKVFLKPFWACFSSFKNCLLAKNQKVLHICCSYYLDISNIPNRFPETLFNILVSTLIVFLCLENFVGVFGSFESKFLQIIGNNLTTILIEFLWDSFWNMREQQFPEQKIENPVMFICV